MRCLKRSVQNRGRVTSNRPLNSYCAALLTLSWMAHSQSGLHVLSQHHICPRISRAVRPNWAILGSTGSAILRCCNVGRATVATATRWPNSSRHCPFYALARHVPAPPAHPMRLGRCGTVCRRSQGCHGHSESAQGRLFDPEKWRGAALLRTLLQRGDTPLRNPPVPHRFSGQCGRNSGHFFREHLILLSVHGRDGLSRPFPRLVRGSNEVGRA